MLRGTNAMSTDCFSETRSLASALDAEGLSSEASALRDALDGGSTGGEILMAVRWHLQAIDHANKPFSVATKRRIRELLRELNVLVP